MSEEAGDNVSGTFHVAFYRGNPGQITCNIGHSMMRLYPMFLAVFFPLLSSGCSGRQPTTADVIGRWVADSASMRFIKSANPIPRCEITFSADGTFITPGVPDFLCVTPDRASGRLISGKGRWSLVRDQGSFVVQLDFREMNGKSVQFQTLSLIAEARKSQCTLFCWVGEEGGDRFDFHRAK